MWKIKSLTTKNLIIKKSLHFFRSSPLLIAILLFSQVSVANAAISTGASNPPKKVALVMKALSNPFFSNMAKGAKDYAQKKGIQLEVFGIERETEVQEQITIVERLIQQNYPAIVIAPADSKRLVPVIKEALKKHIVVINIDNPLDKKALNEAGINVPFVGSDNFTGSSLIGKYVRNKFPTGGNVLYIEGIRGNKNADLRKSGFISSLKGGAFNIVGSITANWHSDEAMTQVVEFLSKHPQHIDIIACANDVMALGALQAINTLSEGKTPPLITGYDNIPEVRSELLNGQIQATIEQHPEMMGAYGLKLAEQGLQGIPLPEYKHTPLDLISYDTFGKKILFSVSNLKNPFFSTIVEGAQKAAELHGLNLEVADAQNDSVRQLDNISTYLENGTDLIIINPTDSVSVGPGIELANSENIPVIAVDRQSIDGTVIAHIASDNRQGARMAAQYIDDNLPGRGKILEIQGILGTSAAHERGTEFNAYFKDRKNITIERITADFDNQKSQKIMSKLLQTGHHYDAIFAHNDEMILGALKALQQFNDKKSIAGEETSFQFPILVGFDAIDNVIEAINQEKINATIAQNPYLMGRTAISVAADILRNMTINPEIKVDLQLIKKGTAHF